MRATARLLASAKSVGPVSQTALSPARDGASTPLELRPRRKAATPEILRTPIGIQPRNEQERQELLAARAARRPGPIAPLVPFEDPAPPELQEPLRWQRGFGVLSYLVPLATLPVLVLYADWDSFMGGKDHVFKDWARPKLAEWTTLSRRDAEKLLRERRRRQDEAAATDAARAQPANQVSQAAPASRQHEPTRSTDFEPKRGVLSIGRPSVNADKIVAMAAHSSPPSDRPRRVHPLLDAPSGYASV